MTWHLQNRFALLSGLSERAAEVSNMEMLSVKNFFFTLFILSSVIPCGLCGLILSDCYNCVRFHQRYANGTCPPDEFGCTICINGSVIDPDNLDTCLELNVTENPPEETRGTLGEIVIINCMVTAKVECSWKKEGQVMELARHSRYQLKIQTEPYTTDCGLIIYNASSEDQGLWTCTNRPIDHEFNNNYTFAAHTWVYVEQPAVVVVDQSASSARIISLTVVFAGLGLVVIVLAIYIIAKNRRPRQLITSPSTETMVRSA